MTCTSYERRIKLKAKRPMKDLTSLFLDIWIWREKENCNDIHIYNTIIITELIKFNIRNIIKQYLIVINLVTEVDQKHIALNILEKN